MRPANAGREVWPVKLTLLTCGLYLISACWHVLYGGMNSDEGFYAVAARSVWHGELPYRDFGYTQMPLFPYINGALMQLTGFGLFEQRAVNGLWGALTLLLASIWLARRTSPAWALGLVTLFSLSAPWMYFIHLGKTYAFVGLITVAALWVFMEWTPRVSKVAALALLGTLGLGCRLPIAPYFVLLWLAAVIELPNHDWKTMLQSAAGSIVWPIIFVLPFFVAAPDAAIFWTFGFHRATLTDRNWHLPWQVVVALAPVLWLGFFGGLINLSARRLSLHRKELVVAAITIVALAICLLPLGVFEEYSVPLLPPLAMITCVIIWRAGQTIPWLRHPALPVAAIVINLGLSVAVQWPDLPSERRHSYSMFLPLKAPAYNFALPQRLALARHTVERYLPANRPLIGPMIILAAETGRRVPRNLRLGAFSVTADFPPAQAQRLNLSTLPEVEAYLTNSNLPLLALSKNPYNNYSCSMPSFQNSAPFKSFVWSEFFREYFQVAYEDDDFLLLVRRTTTPAG